jgi:hypothetical protein
VELKSLENMPIISKDQGRPDLNEPSPGAEMARYLSLYKFISLLKEGKMFFCRLDKLEDKFEGTMTETAFDQLMSEYKYLRDVRQFFDRPITDKEFEVMAKSRIGLAARMKSNFCVNCWNRYETESYALWKIYGGQDQGIMIKTTYAKLIDAFSKEPRNLYCSEVKYMDYSKDPSDIGNVIIPITRKRKPYSYESEIRLIHGVDLKNGLDYDWSKEEYKNGMMMKVDLSELIKEVIISPFAPKQLGALIGDLLAKYSIEASISQSILT